MKDRDTHKKPEQLYNLFFLVEQTYPKLDL